LYAYVGGNPVTYTDPHGLMPSKSKTKFAVSIVPRSLANGGGMKLRVTGRPKKFSDVTLRELAARPGNGKYFTDSSGKKFKKSGFSRNHIQAWYTIAKEHRTATRGFTRAEMEDYLRNDIDVSTFNNKIYKNRFAKIVAKTSTLTISDLQRAFLSVIVDEYNNSDNLFIGHSGTNSSGGSIMKHRHTKLKKTYGTNQLTSKQRGATIREFRDAGLDTPGYYTAAQIQEAQDRFNDAWGRNKGKYI
jgi:hydroxymethylpyrimidine pyrophosphatase-like HAD family hydrolase